MRQKKFLYRSIWAALLLMATVGYSRTNDPILSIRVLEKMDLQELKVLSSSKNEGWDEVKLTRGYLTVNGKAQKEASWGSPDSSVKVKTFGWTRIYPGRITISISTLENKPGLFILDQVPLSTYVGCVTASESDHDRSQPEYLKALAVVIRGYALVHLHRHPNYDLCDLTHCQVYQGLPNDPDFWKKVSEPSQEMEGSLRHRSWYFQHCCGGVLESVADIWGGPEGKKLASRTGPDQFHGVILCGSDPHFHWTSSAKIEQLEEVFRKLANLPEEAELKDLRVLKKTPGGRNKKLAAVFTLPGDHNREVYVSAQSFVSEFGRQYGWMTFPSSLFTIKKDGDSFRFSGNGFGHGVGFCQAGALRLAQLGWKWREILQFYFPDGTGRDIQ